MVQYLLVIMSHNADISPPEVDMAMTNTSHNADIPPPELDMAMTNTSPAAVNQSDA